MFRNHLLTLCILSCLFSGCNKETGFAGFTGAEYERLLASDSVKVWHKRHEKINGETTRLDECRDLTLLEFGYLENNPDNKYFEVKHNPGSCSGDSSVIGSGSWLLTTNSTERIKTDTILFITGPDTTLKWIREISALNLELISDQHGDELLESYTYEEGKN